MGMGMEDGDLFEVLELMEWILGFLLETSSHSRVLTWRIGMKLNLTFERTQWPDYR
jgi:hypothetical protein